MKKIKSVRLKNDYRTAYYFLVKGTLLINDGEGYWTTYNHGHHYLDDEIRNCKTDLFEIEYEEERKYVDVRIEFSNLDFSDFYPDVITSLERKIKKQFEYANVKVTKLAEGTL